MFLGLCLSSFPRYRFICYKVFPKFYFFLDLHRGNTICPTVSCLKHNFRTSVSITFDKMPLKRGKKVQKKEPESDESQHSSLNESSAEEEVARKGRTKKTEKNDKKKVETDEHSVSEDESQSDSEAKTTRSKKNLSVKKVKTMKAEESENDESDVSDDGKNKKRKKKAPSVAKKGTKRNTEGEGDAPPDKKAKLEPPSKPELKDLNFDCEKNTSNGDKWNYKISTWNVAGLRAWLKKGGTDFIKKEDPDIICLQETKCSEKKLPPEAKLTGYHVHWANSVKEGYAGVALYSKEKPISIKKGIGKKEHDAEGRVITAEFEQFYLVTTYVPNAGQGLKTLPKRLQWDPDFRNYLKELDSKKPVILCGDLNVAHTEIDLANPKTNTKSAGFTKEEREGMTTLLKEGFVDTFRHLYPDQKGAYTFWSYFNNARARNTGWRLDYFILSEKLMPHLCDNVIRNQVYGSDHCPVTLFLHI